MAKTIKEMADTQYPFKFGGSKTIADKKRTEGFIDGANAVLEEVERTISVSEEGWLESNLKLLVKQLKGE